MFPLTQKMNTVLQHILCTVAVCVISFTAMSAQNILAPWTQDRWVSNADITVLEESDGRVFAGTSNAGLFYTDDNGDNWKSTTDALAMRTILAWLKTDAAIFVSGKNGIFRSIDNGDSWTVLESSPGVALPLIVDMTQLGTTIVAANPAALYSSDDQGLSWQQIELEAHERLSSLQFMESHNNLLYLSSSHSVYSLDIHASVEERKLLSSNAPVHDPSMLKTQRSQLYLAAIEPSRGDIVFRQGEESTSWQNVSNNIPSGTNTYDIVASDERYYIASNMGVFASADGRNWLSIHTGSTTLPCKRLTISDGFLLIGTATSGVHRYDIGDASKDIEQVNNGLNSWSATKVWQTEQRVIVQSNGTGTLDKARNTDDQWAQVQSNSSDPIQHTAKIVAFNDEFLMASDVIYSSVDEGRSWQERATSIFHEFSDVVVTDTDIFGFNRFEVVHIAADNTITAHRLPNFDSFSSVFAQGDAVFGSVKADGRLFRSTDQGRSWLDIGTGLPNRPMLTVWASADRILGATSTSLVESRDGGDTWTEVSIDDLSEGSVIREITEYNGHIYLLKKDGIWYQDSDNQGWSELDLEGLPHDVHLNSMSIREGLMYICTLGDGVFSTTLDGSISSVGTESLNILNLQISPNPVKQNSKLVYTLEQKAQVEINVFDLLGNSVVEPIRGYRDAGTFTQELKANGLTSGQYILVVRAGEETVTQQFAVVR